MTNLNYKKINSIALAICLITLMISGCGFKNNSEVVGNRVFHDDIGRAVNIEKATKIVALSNSFLEKLSMYFWPSTGSCKIN